MDLLPVLLLCGLYGVWHKDASLDIAFIQWLLPWSLSARSSGEIRTGNAQALIAKLWGAVRTLAFFFWNFEILKKLKLRTVMIGIGYCAWYHTPEADCLMFCLMLCFLTVRPGCDDWTEAWYAWAIYRHVDHSARNKSHIVMTVICAVMQTDCSWLPVLLSLRRYHREQSGPRVWHCPVLWILLKQQAATGNVSKLPKLLPLKQKKTQRTMLW